MGSYGLALWAMTQAPLAVVAALRETSILFGALLAFLMLKEKVAGLRLLRPVASLRDFTAPVLIILAIKCYKLFTNPAWRRSFFLTPHLVASHYCGRFLSHFTVMAAPYSLFIYF
jgi:hypothetical protein